MGLERAADERPRTTEEAPSACVCGGSDAWRERFALLVAWRGRPLGGAWGLPEHVVREGGLPSGTGEPDWPDPQSPGAHP